MITINNLSFSYDNSPFLQHVNLHIGKGCFCAVMGPNGSGKSTLLKLMVNLLVPNSGEILVNGKSLNDYSQRELAKMISYVPQREDIIFEFSVYDTVMMGRNPYQGRWGSASADDDRLVCETLERTHLAHLKDRLLSQLSGGELQRTLIARAMVQHAPVMLLDEPLANLDIAHKFEIMDILAQLQHDTGTTLLLILHDFPMALQYADTALLMQNGNICHYGPCREVLTSDIIKPTFHLDERFTVDENGNIRRTGNGKLKTEN
ncbi:MAG: ABC transporter ATP-binding protein [Bacteroidales bacterium]|nr:ABC transporter ATP-binding protein [Bacteroidales bacterium]